jgi:hypothetical protein
MNDLIKDFEDSFNNLQSHAATMKPGNRDAMIFRRYQVRGEILINSLKTTADQLLALLSILKSRVDDGCYADKIGKDSIGMYLNSTNLSEDTLEFMQKHAYILKELNDAANGSKHSFLNLNVNTYMSRPSVLVYHLPRNNQSEVGSPVTMTLEKAIPEYNSFLEDITKLIVKYAKSI